MSTTVIRPAQPEKILKELGQVWTRLAKDEAGQGKPTVLRACAMTLIVATDDEDEEVFSAAQTLTELMHEHPSRGIVLNSSQKAEPGLEARVLAQCWKPFGKAQQICCEQIEITADPESWPNVGPTVTGIMAADLPVVLWCRQKTALRASATDKQTAGLEAVMGFASKTIVDTAGLPVEEALGVLAAWKAKSRIVADLEWTRLTSWREVLASVFDDPEKQRTVSHYKSAEIRYLGDTPQSGVLYLSGWLQNALQAKVAIEKQGTGYGEGLQEIHLKSDSETITLRRTSNDCMTLASGGREQRYNYPEVSLYKLMNEELSVLGPDPFFDAAFRGALKQRQG